MFLLISMAYTAIEKREDALLSQHFKPFVEASGSLGIRTHDGTCQATSPNQTLVGDSQFDWCSNVMKSTDDSPWISYRLPNKAMKIRGFSVRNGCCFDDAFRCCCDPQSGADIDNDCCCRLYRFSLQGSNDNKTWKTIHKVAKDNRFLWCELKTYEFDLSEPFNIIRFMMDEAYPGCPKCLQLNQIELYGETVNSDFDPYENEEDNEESVSIIGRVKKF